MKVLSIVIKDLKTVLSDKKAMAIILLMPLVLTVILSFSLKGSFADEAGWGMRKLNIAVVRLYDKELDEERFDDSLRSGFLSRAMGEEAAEELLASGDDINPEKMFLEDFLGSEDVRKIIEYSVETEDKAAKLLKDGEISAVVLLPEKFVYDMKINLITPFRNKVDIKVLTHPDKAISGQVAQAVVDAFSDAISSFVIGKNVLIEAALAHELGEYGFKGIKEVMDGLSDAMESIRVSFDDVKVEERKQVSSADYYAAAMLTMFILFAAGHGGRMLLEEKENITYQRMVIEGVSRLEILTGKFFTVFLIALVQIAVMIAFSHFALKVKWGGTPAVLLISIASALAVAGLGTALAAATYKAGNYRMANAFENVIIQIMALLGGSYFPADVLPPAFQKLGFLSINGIALKAYLKIMKGYGTSDVIINIAVLAGIGALFVLLAVLILRGKGGIADVKYNKVKALKA